MIFKNLYRSNETNSSVTADSFNYWCFEGDFDWVILIYKAFLNPDRCRVWFTATSV